MYTRIGDAAQNARVSGLIQETQVRMQTAEVEIATGKRAQTFSELGSETSLLLRAHEQETVTAKFISQNNIVGDRIQVMDGVVGTIADLGSQLRTLLVERLNGALGSAVPVASEVDAMLQEIGSQLNFKLDGRYLFSGSRTDVRPIDLPATVTGPADIANAYRGDQIKLTTRADSDVEVTYGVTADQFQPLMTLFAEAKQAHNADDLPALEAIMDNLAIELSNVADIQGNIGAQAKRLGTIADAQTANLDYLQDMISRIEDTDIAEAVSKLARDQTTLEAAYLAVSRIASLSLADYLR